MIPKTSPFPITIIDDFFDDMEYVEHLYNNAEFAPVEDQVWPGLRSKPLQEVSPYLHHFLCRKFFSIWFQEEMRSDTTNPLKYHVLSFFQKIEPYHEDPEHVLNLGWPHYDQGAVGAGVIYLNRESPKRSGTSFYRPLELREALESQDKTSPEKNSMFQGKVTDLDNHIAVKEKHLSKFEKTVEVSNVHNRLVAYGSQFHSETNFFCSGEETRKTLVFFITQLENVEPPTLRMSRGI
jgi:hypothetical protein